MLATPDWSISLDAGWAFLELLYMISETIQLKVWDLSHTTYDGIA